MLHYRYIRNYIYLQKCIVLQRTHYIKQGQMERAKKKPKNQRYAFGPRPSKDIDALLS